jgi:hypothetical protein
MEGQAFTFAYAARFRQHRPAWRKRTLFCSVFDTARLRGVRLRLQAVSGLHLQAVSGLHLRLRL